MYLFLDSSSYIQVGILDKELSWIHHEIVPNRKGSQILHSVIYSCLKENDLKISDIKTIFLGNGPGSYTGIRVAEGICQVLEVGGAEVFSFYHFEVPAFCGIQDYDFFSEAFKGEVFFYKRRGENSDISLIKEESFTDRDDSIENQFSLQGEILEESLDSVYDLFKSNSSKIFSQVLERRERKPPYYYRSVESEFKPSFKI